MKNIAYSVCKCLMSSATSSSAYASNSAANRAFQQWGAGDDSTEDKPLSVIALPPKRQSTHNSYVFEVEPHQHRFRQATKAEPQNTGTNGRNRKKA